MPTYLFVLCPPYCGSTLLWKLLSTSPNVSALPAEGQFLPELKDTLRSAPWKRDTELPWPEIKAVWQSYWDMEKPILLEKSPPNLIRAAEIAAHFAPATFIVMVRNPYAHAEGLMRRNGWAVERAANFCLMCLRTQRENSARLENLLTITYESLVANTAAEVDRLLEFLPTLASIDHAESFEIHSVDGTLRRPITDLNKKKIASLPDALVHDLTALFAPEQELLGHWGYSLMK